MKAIKIKVLAIYAIKNLLPMMKTKIITNLKVIVNLLVDIKAHVTKFVKNILHIIINQLAISFKVFGSFQCLGENSKKCITF